MSDSKPFLILGHRGSQLRARENTVESFRLSIAEGADGFETDVRRLADGSVVLFHDEEISGRLVESMTIDELEQLAGPVARAEELIQFSNVLVNLEVKRSGWEGELRSIALSMPNTVICSFDHRLVERLHSEGLADRLGIVVDCRLVDSARYAQRLGAHWYFPAVRHVDEELVSSLHELGIRVIPWTANHPAVWARLHSAGCDGVITDRPAEAVQWRDFTRLQMC